MDKPIEQKKGLKKKHIPYLAGTVFILLFIGWAIFGNHQSSLRVDKDKVTVEEVTRGVFNDYIRIMGNVEPLNFSQLTAIEGGRVKEQFKEAGEMVKAGEIILRLENQSLETEIINNEAGFVEEQNNTQNALLDLEKETLNLQQERLNTELDTERKKRKYLQNEQLYKEDLIAKEEYLIAKEDYEFAIKSQRLISEKQAKDSIRRHRQAIIMKDKLENKKRNLILTRERYAQLEVCAPIDGQLGELNIEIGQYISSGTQIGKINVLGKYKVSTLIDEHYIDRVRKDLEATLERQGKDFNMKVIKVYPDVKEGQFKTDLEFTEEVPDNIRTGQTYHINLQLGASDESILIPRGSFYQSTGGQWIYVLTPDGKEAYRRKIKIGKQNPRYYQVLEGIQPGEKVITSGYEMYGDNERLILK
ncbi:efflux RND transporter periplasmic adaptor subunit [uncultured Sanguibacteroides sp.]|uniref:efflux RND transporter periplasmic adaptor subunit n=1 Tax=uncultured Sanguibacteroides sp. TaxID=1635151 RepID=UPI0025F3D8D4|nr:efflux RND transporter periplasmic adaptor subunit [uncultured Sanguibacteroides sp.]